MRPGLGVAVEEKDSASAGGTAGINVSERGRRGTPGRGAARAKACGAQEHDAVWATGGSPTQRTGWAGVGDQAQQAGRDGAGEDTLVPGAFPS